MTLAPNSFPVSDVEDFAKHLGLDGTDADMFYESYYLMDTEEEYEYMDYLETDTYLA